MTLLLLTRPVPVSSAITGTLGVVEAADTFAASGTHTAPTITGVLGVTEAADALADFDGTHTPPTITGTLGATEAADAMSVAITVANPVLGTLGIVESPDALRIHANRFGKQPTEVPEAGPIFMNGRPRRRYYNPSRNPVTGP